MPALVVTPSAEPPDLVGLLRDHLRVDDEQHDLLLGYLQAAVSEFESATGRAVLSTAFNCYWDRFPSGSTIKLGKGRVSSVASLSYVPAATGTAMVWPSTNYVVDLASDPARIVLATGASWPTDKLVAANGLIVQLTAGWDLDDLPGDIRSALLFRVQSMFDGGPGGLAEEQYLARLDRVWTATIRRYRVYA